ncbi:MAG: hypothetical protein M3N48_15460 [Verrucomicrobiota bacterium]|nr:hypothetical protein [Verrucomicrobiota bacterium]
MNTPPNARARSFRIPLVALIIAASPFPAFGYGDDGHKTVGAIADILIANSPNTLAHVRTLLPNQTLEKTRDLGR